MKLLMGAGALPFREERPRASSQLLESAKDFVEKVRKRATTLEEHRFFWPDSPSSGGDYDVVGIQQVPMGFTLDLDESTN